MQLIGSGDVVFNENNYPVNVYVAWEACTATLPASCTIAYPSIPEATLNKTDAAIYFFLSHVYATQGAKNAVIKIVTALGFVAESALIFNVSWTPILACVVD